MCNNYHGCLEQSCNEQPSQTKLYEEKRGTPYFVDLFCVPAMHKKETVTNDAYYKYDEIFHLCVCMF